MLPFWFTFVAVALQILIGSLSVYSTETYGTDTTYYLADAEDLVPSAAEKPDKR